MAHTEESVETTSDFVNFSNEDIPAEPIEMVDVRGFLADSTKLKDFITCRNCKQEFDHDAHKPFLLPCLDAICKSCTQDISTLEKQGLECDKCHCIHICIQNGDLSLQVDSTREIASEILRLTKGDSSLICEMCTNHKIASHRCLDCALFICVECVKLHSALKPFKSHTVSEIKGLLSEEKNCMSLFRKTVHCPVNGHENETLKMYCLDSACMKPVCVLCCITTHKEHVYCNIAEVGKENKTKIGNILKNVASKVDQAQKTVTELKDMNDKCLLDSQQLQKEIKARFSEAKKALELREKILCDAVAEQVNDKQRCIENEKKKITSFINSCKQACYYGNISPKLNDHQSFLAIGNSIQLQLENLERQVIENQVGMDIMKFSPKPSDACFTTSINDFGKLLVTKVNPTKSKAVVTSPVCYQGEEVRFQIQLYSSTGIPIVDENISVQLKNRGKISKSVQCATGTSSSTFTGKWVPDEPLQLSWIVVSNGIELETLEGTIRVKATETKQDILKKNPGFYCDNLTNSQRLQKELCCICMDTPTKPTQLQKCGHIFCKECIKQCFQYNPICPSCGTIYGKVTGDQPPGTMSIGTNGFRLQGFNDSSGTIVLTYILNGGEQGAEHPDPGKVFKGINRSGYLPLNKKGMLIAKLLNVAFSRRLVFTIGRSRTTGHDGVIIWNDIHHKTRMDGGPAKFGYPDPTYLDRVLEELEVKGVTEESADDPEEYKEYSRQIGF